MLCHPIFARRSFTIDMRLAVLHENVQQKKIALPNKQPVQPMWLSELSAVERAAPQAKGITGTRKDKYDELQ
jgi:hypothetical protein